MSTPVKITAPPEPGELTFRLLRLLADGEFHSGEVLAQLLGISRTSVNNALRGLEAYGLKLYSVRGRGYCLANSPDWLDAKKIAGHLGALETQFQIEVLNRAESSNTLLLQRARLNVEKGGPPQGTVLAVEWQSSGRGRRGRPWHSGLGNALTFSLLWRFDCGLSALSGLSLATGVALIRALRNMGIEGTHLKWPNDVLGDRGKLAGILIEAQGDMLGPSAVVIGIGLNLSLKSQVLSQIDQPVTSLMDMLDDDSKMPERNFILAAILRELNGVLHEFAQHGFASMRAEWQNYHAMQNKRVQLQLPDGKKISGIVRGVANDGALELQTSQEIRRYNVGEISLRSLENAAA